MKSPAILAWGTHLSGQASSRSPLNDFIYAARFHVRQAAVQFCREYACSDSTGRRFLITSAASRRRVLCQIMVAGKPSN